MAIPNILTSLLVMLLVLTPVVAAAAADPVPSNGCVVVTGATGWVAGHVIETLFQKGFKVHGTVRDTSNKKKLQHLLLLEQKYKPMGASLQLFQADLFEKNAYDEAAKGCVGFMHVASVVVKEDDDPQVQVNGAIMGTVSALVAAKKANIKHVVVTSSVASLSPTLSRLSTKLEQCSRAYDVTDTNDYASLRVNTYSYSKTMAEKAMKEWMVANESPFRLSTTHFAMAWGPQQTSRVTSSQNVVLVVAKREWPFYAPLYFHGVDVRDVARAHVHLFMDTRASGRYIIALDQQETAVSMHDVNLALKEDASLYRQLHYSIEWKLPVWMFSKMLWLNPLLDRSMLVAAKRGHGCGFDGTRLVKELQFEYLHTSIQQTIRDSAQSFVKFGLVGLERPKWHWLGAVVVVVLFVAVMYRCCCCRRSAAVVRVEKAVEDESEDNDLDSGDAFLHGWKDCIHGICPSSGREYWTKRDLTASTYENPLTFAGGGGGGGKERSGHNHKEKRS